MEVIGQMFSFTLSLFQIPFTLYGHTMSMWEVLLWSVVAGLVIWFIKEVRD